MILLSVFDGIGCAKMALDIITARTNYELLGYLAWEIDQDCVELTTRAHGAVHPGDFLKDSVEDVAQLISTWDPNEEAITLLCAGPPCPDYSRDEVEDIKFEQFASWQKQLIALLGRRKIIRLTENVIPHRRGRHPIL